ncbi:transmembrane emp24 domain-containing protein 9 [Vombatus ursinus]|nr:transmembrane emp24 domain-containing protein 9 [Vombatus ursinus]
MGLFLSQARLSGWQLQEFREYQVLFAEQPPLVVSSATLDPVKQLHQTWWGQGRGMQLGWHNTTPLLPQPPSPLPHPWLTPPRLRISPYCSPGCSLPHHPQPQAPAPYSLSERSRKFLPCPQPSPEPRMARHLQCRTCDASQCSWAPRPHGAWADNLSDTTLGAQSLWAPVPGRVSKTSLWADTELTSFSRSRVRFSPDCRGTGSGVGRDQGSLWAQLKGRLLQRVFLDAHRIGVRGGSRRALARLFPLLFLLGLAARGSALYFHIGETEKKCFIEEIPDETMVIGNYRTQLYDKQREEYQPATPGLGMFVEVKDPDDKVILSRQYGSEGRFTFTSHTPGEHQICLHSNSTKFSLFAGGMLRVHLDIQVGEHANDYAEIAAKDKLSELQLRVRQLVEQVEQIQKEQNYQRWREERFRQTSESTNQRVLWWSIVQTLILVAIGVWQMRHLKSFFEAKKLV